MQDSLCFLNVEYTFRNNVLRFLGYFGGSLWVPGGKLFSVLVRAGFLVKKEANKDEQGRARTIKDDLDRPPCVPQKKNLSLIYSNIEKLKVHQLVGKKLR